ncbi:MAG: ABC-2 transporter permease [Gemmatimonadota bacterium]|nr:MAG: ABC-2 transporter permease [Gemmatimonadota bacterium]
MLEVIKKDLILNRNVMLLNTVVFTGILVVVAVWLSESPPTRLFAGFAGLMMAFLPAITVTREDRFNATALGCSLPVRRKTIVRARFVLSVGTALLGLVGTFLLVSLLPHSHYRVGDLFDRGPLVTALTVIAIALSLLLPFILRFGMNGVLIFLVATQVLGVLLLTVVSVAGFAQHREIVGQIVAGFVRLRELTGPAAFSGLMAAVLLALLTLSYLVSARVFENREL